MINSAIFSEECYKQGFDFFTGVPCSYLKPFINYIIGNDRFKFIMATNEGEAVGIATGAFLGGKYPIVMCQNSGLGNIINPLTSLVLLYKIPILFIITLRGEQGKDAPQHSIMGELTPRFLDLLKIPWEFFPTKENEIVPALQRCVTFMKKYSLPYVFIMRKGSVAPEDIQNKKDAMPPLLSDQLQKVYSCPGQRIFTKNAVACLLTQFSPEDLVLTTTGRISRSAYYCCDRESTFYMVGSMGCASAIGLGLSEVKSDRKVFIIDGDAAILMKMGNLATIGYHRPANLRHIVLDNEGHATTGGQKSVTSFINLAAVAKACGYPDCYNASTGKEIDIAMSEIKLIDRLSFLHVKTLMEKESAAPRPPYLLEQIKERFMRSMND